jgi:hypothetical protein
MERGLMSPTAFREPEALAKRRSKSKTNLMLACPDGDESPPQSAAMGRLKRHMEIMQPALAASVVAALHPQIAELEACVSSLRQDAAHLATPPTPEMDPADLAAAVTSALSGRFEELARQTAAAASMAQLAAMSSQAEVAAPSHQMAEALIKELLPQMAGPLESSIEEALRPRLQELEQSLASRRHRNSPNPSRENTARENTSRENTDKAVSEHSKRTEQIALRRMQHRMLRGISSTSYSAFGRMQSQSTLAQNTLPQKAFVVNFRRLVEVQKMLSIIHEFIRSTAIAALTLVAAANWRQLTFSIVFVTLVLALFAVHEMRHDRMDIEDYKSLLELLEDDDGENHGEKIQNPNRLLKALSISRTRNRRSRSWMTCILSIAIIGIVWTNIFWAWASIKRTEKWLGVFNEDDRMVQATLLLVGTAMVIFHVSYEWLYWRETHCVLPMVEDKMDKTFGKRPWDPKSSADGVPRKYRWFGLPSMWFTSRQAYDDLRLWTTLSRKEDDLVTAKLHLEEMALYALRPEGAQYLRKTLEDAKLFSMGKWQFLTRDGEGSAHRAVNKGEDPEKLGMSFVFYDSCSEQFLQPPADYEAGLMRLLQKTASDVGKRTSVPSVYS